MANQVNFVDGRVGVVMDAQRSQVYYAEYVSGKGKVRKSGRPELWYPSDLESHLRKRRLYLVGDGGLRCLEQIRKRTDGWPRLLGADLFLASAVGKLAASKRRSWKSGEYLIAAPLYIRPPDALRPRGRK